MANITTIMQTQLEPIILAGCLSPDDIHNLSLVDKVLFKAITDPARAQSLWKRHLPFVSVFLLNRSVRVYDHLSDEKGSVFIYTAKICNGHQLVCRQQAATGKPDILIAQEVKHWYDLWISFLFGDRLKTLDDVLLFQERHGKDFPDADYTQFMTDNHPENANNEMARRGFAPIYLEIALMSKYILEGVRRFENEATLESGKHFDKILKSFLIPMITQGYFDLDYLNAFFYLMGKETLLPGPFQCLGVILSSNMRTLGSQTDDIHKQIVKQHNFQIAQEDYLYYLHRVGDPEAVLYGRTPLSEKPQENECREELREQFGQTDFLPGFTYDLFSATVCFDFSYRNRKALLTHVTYFNQMIQEGYLTFDRLNLEYRCSESNQQFMINYCTPVFFNALRQNLIRFHVIEFIFFRRLPFIFHLENRDDLQVPKSLHDFSAAFIDFLKILQKRGLQKDFDEFYAVPFFELFVQFSGKKYYTKPSECIVDYLKFEQGEGQSDFFKAVSRGDFTAESLMTTYKRFVDSIEQTLTKHIGGLGIKLEDCDFILSSRPHHAYFMRLFIFGYVNRMKSTKMLTIEDAVNSFMTLFETFCKEMITPALVAILVDGHFIKEFKEFYDYVYLSDSFVKTRVGLHQYTLDKRRKFDDILTILDAIEYMNSAKGSVQQDVSFSLLKSVITGVHSFNRRVIERTSQYSSALPGNPMLIQMNLDILKQLELYSVLSEEKAIDAYVAITSQYYIVVASLFGEKTALNLVNMMITSGRALTMSAMIAGGHVTMNDYCQFLLQVLKMSFRIRSRSYFVILRIEIFIEQCVAQFMNKLYKSIMKGEEVDYAEVVSHFEQWYDLVLPPEEEAAEGEVEEA